MVDRRQWLVRRHIEHFQNGTTDFHPDGARFIPASEYLDPEIVKAERAFLRTVPLMAAHSSQLPGPHAYRCEDILRSEEHTSELQSLMRISYAVFCLKKKQKEVNL